MIVVCGARRMADPVEGDETEESLAMRERLTRLVDEYLSALVANDPAAVPLAADVRFVEKIEPTAPGAGLWGTASAAPEDFRLYVPDPAARQVGFLGVVSEAGDPVLLGLRLQLDDGRISEVEHVIGRGLTPGLDGHTNLDNLEAPRSIFRHPVPPAHRNTRPELLEIAEDYYDAVIEDDGGLAPFAPNCVRRENGFQTTCKTPPPDPDAAQLLRTLDCGEQLDSGAMSYITGIEPVRVDIADVETGLVCGFSQLRHSMEETTLDIVGVPELDAVEREYDPFDTVAMHVFRISGGKIRGIEAVGFRAPYDAPTGWESR